MLGKWLEEFKQTATERVTWRQWHNSGIIQYLLYSRRLICLKTGFTTFSTIKKSGTFGRFVADQNLVE